MFAVGISIPFLDSYRFVDKVLAGIDYFSSAPITQANIEPKVPAMSRAILESLNSLSNSFWYLRTEGGGGEFNEGILTYWRVLTQTMRCNQQTY
jgi:hypothetical protein